MTDEPEIELPEDAAFWTLVGLARADWDRFERRLRELSTPAVAGFAHMYYGLEASLTERARLLIASEDGADDFCGWVVAQGKAFYTRALADPETLDDATVAQFDRESDSRARVYIRYTAEDVYRERTGEELCPFVEPLYDPYDSDEYGPLLQQNR